LPLEKKEEGQKSKSLKGPVPLSVQTVLSTVSGFSRCGFKKLRPPEDIPGLPGMPKDLARIGLPL
jgi:hypothetical protein